MQIYRVGGAVRDKLLGLPVKDQDWVVVGASPEIMKTQGFIAVGKDFPVFLHPNTKEEYALARTERKSGHGYGGFTFYTDSKVTLEEDLLRRDLTINAMAEDKAGNIIDPYGGQSDLEERILRHVSAAFSEDPLRILRTARFHARLSPLGFIIADETLTLMRSMTRSGEASYLVPERVWQETRSALMEDNPDQYFLTLQQCGALNVVLPELCNSSLERVLGYIKKSARQKMPEMVRFGCLFIPDLLIPDNGAEKTEQPIDALSKRLRLPSAFTELARLISQYAQKALQLCRHLEPVAMISLLKATDALRRPERFELFLDSLSLAFDEVLKQKLFSLECLQQCLAIRAKDVMSESITGKEVGLALEKARLSAVTELILNRDQQKHN